MGGGGIAAGRDSKTVPIHCAKYRLWHSVYDLTLLRPGAASLQPHCISPSTFVVLFGMDQESPNGAQNMEVGWQPKNERKPAKYLWSSSQVNPGQGITLPDLSSK